MILNACEKKTSYFEALKIPGKKRLKIHAHGSAGPLERKNSTLKTSSKNFHKISFKGSEDL